MADEDSNEPPNQLVPINRDEAWNIISNQIEVQEQLRTRAYQILSILSAVAVLIAGISFSISFTVPETPFENAIDSFWLSESELSIFILLHWIIAILLGCLASFLLAGHIIRNYRASRHSSLKPGLGDKDEFSLFFVTTKENQNILDRQQIATQQYNEWILSNAEILEGKRQELNLAHYNLFLSAVCLGSAALIYFYSNNAIIVPLFWIDLAFFTIIATTGINILRSRDEWLNREAWLGTLEFKFIIFAALTLLLLIGMSFLLLLWTILVEYGVLATL